MSKIVPHIQAGTSGLGYLNPFNYDLGLSERLAGNNLNYQGGSILGQATVKDINLNNQIQQTPPSTDPNIAAKAAAAKAAAAKAAARSLGGKPPVTNTSIPSSPTPQSNTPSIPDMSEQINSIYNPLVQNLNAKQGALAGQQQLENDTLNQQYGDLNQMVKDQMTGVTTDVNNQTSALNEGKRSAYGESLRQFNLLQQQNQSRFGGSTGAGSFISDLLNQEWMRSNGNRDAAYTNSIKSLQDYSNRATEGANKEYMRLEKEKNLAGRAIQEEFTSRLQAIEADRRMLDSAKASMKFQVMQEAVQQQQTVQNAYLQHQYDLESWSAQQKSIVQDGITQTQKLYEMTNQGNAENKKAATTSTEFSNVNGGQTDTISYENIYSPKKNLAEAKPVEDPYDITNIFQA